MTSTPQTYELYLLKDGRPPRFEPLTCPKDEVLPRVRRLIEERRISSVEVRQMGLPMSTVGR